MQGTVLVISVAGNLEMQRWDYLNWHVVCTKLNENLSVGSEVIGVVQTRTQRYSKLIFPYEIGKLR
jgi:hypothetical protein